MGLILSFWGKKLRNELVRVLIVLLSGLQLFFKERVQDEQGYVLFVRKNALQVLIPKYGLEGTLFLNAAKKGAASLFSYHEEVRARDSTQYSGQNV